MKKHHGNTLLEIVIVIVTLITGVGLLLATALGTNQGVSTGIGNEP